MLNDNTLIATRVDNEEYIKKWVTVSAPGRQTGIGMRSIDTTEIWIQPRVTGQHLTKTLVWSKETYWKALQMAACCFLFWLALLAWHSFGFKSNNRIIAIKIKTEADVQVTSPFPDFFPFISLKKVNLSLYCVVTNLLIALYLLINWQYYIYNMTYSIHNNRLTMPVQHIECNVFKSYIKQAKRLAFDR